MAWNEPGGNNRDPWGGNGRDQGPPDLDELIRKLTGKFGGLLGDKRGGGSGGSGDSGGSGGSGGSLNIPFRSGGVLLIIGILLVIWMLSGIYIVDAGKRGVELRFGKYSATSAPGLSYHLPYPIESKEIVDVEQLRSKEIGYRSGAGSGRQGAIRSVPREALMLTQDENIVDVRLSVQYLIEDPRAYLFNTSDPNETLVQVVESATREVVGRSTMDYVLTEGRSAVMDEVKQLSQDILDSYLSGLQIANVNLQDAQPPEQVQSAFDDAIKAREDEQRQKNEAEAYANEIVPKARGQAARQLEEAAGYKDQVIARAEGEASRFEQLLAEYQNAPQVTRERLYMETMETVLSKSSKVLIDAGSSNNLLYLPLDKLRQPGAGLDNQRSTAGHPPLIDPSMLGPKSTDNTRLRDTSRGREIR